MLPRGRRCPTIVLLALAWLRASSLAAQSLGTFLEVHPENPTSRDLIVFRLTGTSFCPLRFLGPYLEEGQIFLIGVVDGTYGTCPGPNPVDFTGALGPLPAGTYPIRLAENGPATLSLEVTDPGSELRLHGGRFRVSVEWDPPGGGPPRQASGLRASDQAGTFSFFGEDNVELSLKLLDGRAVNDRFWLFVASLTNLGFRLRVMDVGDGACLLNPPPSCPAYTFENPAGTNANILDFTTVGSLEP